MSQDRLQMALSQLSDLLESEYPTAHEIDASDARWQQIQRLTAEVELLLAHPDTDAEIDSLLEKLKLQMGQFIDEHPRFKAVFQQVTNTLANLGV